MAWIVPLYMVDDEAYIMTFGLDLAARRVRLTNEEKVYFGKMPIIYTDRIDLYVVAYDSDRSQVIVYNKPDNKVKGYSLSEFTELVKTPARIYYCNVEAGLKGWYTKRQQVKGRDTQLKYNLIKPSEAAVCNLFDNEIVKYRRLPAAKIDETMQEIQLCFKKSVTLGVMLNAGGGNCKSVFSDNKENFDR